MRIVAPIPKKILLLRQNFSKIELFFCAAISNSNLKPLLFVSFPQGFRHLKSLDIGLREVGAKRRLNGVNKEKNKKTKKTCSAALILDHFWAKNVQIWDLLFQRLFPKDSESLKILDIRLWEVGAKRRLNSTSKANKWEKYLAQRPWWGGNALVLYHGSGQWMGSLQFHAGNTILHRYLS